MTLPPASRIAAFAFAGGALALAAATPAVMRSRQQSRSRHNPDDAPAGTKHANPHPSGYVVVRAVVTINRDAEEIYDFWRTFENLAFIMDNVADIRCQDNITEWVIAAPLGQTVRIETEIVSDIPGEEIAWVSTEASDIDTHGCVRFRPAGQDRGTHVDVILNYRPPGGRLGRMMAKLTGREPEMQAKSDLKRLKMLLETGEIADARFCLEAEEGE